MSERIKAVYLLALEIIGYLSWGIFGGFTELMKGNIYATLATMFFTVALIATAIWVKIIR